MVGCMRYLRTFISTIQSYYQRCLMTIHLNERLHLLWVCEKFCKEIRNSDMNQLGRIIIKCTTYLQVQVGHILIYFTLTFAAMSDSANMASSMAARRALKCVAWGGGFASYAQILRPRYLDGLRRRRR